MTTIEQTQVTGYETVIDLLVHAVHNDSIVTAETSGLCCDTGNYSHEISSDPVDLLITLAIYRHADDDHQIVMEYVADRWGEQVDTTKPFTVRVESGLTGGEWSTTEFTVTPAAIA